MHLPSESLRPFGPIHYDEPPAPQDPPDNYTPLSPPRRKRSSTVSGILTSTLWNSVPTPLHHLQAPKERARSVDETCLRCLRDLLSADTLVSRHETGSTTDASTPVDGRPTRAEDKNVILTIVSVTRAADSEADVDRSVSENEPQLVLKACDVQEIQGTASTAVSSLTGSPSTTQVAGGVQMYPEMPSEKASHPIDTNERSLVSSLLIEDKHQVFEVTTGSTIGNPKRSKPTSLVLTFTRGEDLQTYGTPTPRTAPPVTIRSPRPLPPIPGGLRQFRPLPQPPVLPPYTSPVGSPPLYGAFQSPSAISQSCSQAMARPSADIVLDQLPDQPNISRRPVAPVILMDPSSETSSAPNVPLSPSLVVAKRHQTSDFNEILDGEITLDIPGTSDTRPTDDKQVGRKIVKLNETTTPALRFRDADISKRQRRMRTTRPQAIYLLGNFSDELYENEEEEEGCTSESSISESLNTSLDLPVDVDAEEDLDDKSLIVSEDGIIPEELDDLEEANIGWASPNIVTYQKESRVKRTTRAWFLEKNGQGWQELNPLREA